MTTIGEILNHVRLSIVQYYMCALLSGIAKPRPTRAVGPGVSIQKTVEHCTLLFTMMHFPMLSSLNLTVRTFGV